MFNLKKQSSMNQVIPYGAFLMHNLMMLDRDSMYYIMEWDIQFESLIGMYEKFEISDFNNVNYSLYDCIKSYLKHIKPHYI